MRILMWTCGLPRNEYNRGSLDAINVANKKEGNRLRYGLVALREKIMTIQSKRLAN